MNLKKKKELAAKTLGVGKNRVVFNPEALAEIKEAITKQDILTLFEEGIIAIKPIKGRAKVEKRKRKRGSGKIKKKIKHRKRDYVRITRKLRGHLRTLKSNNQISKEVYYELRKKIKMRAFKNMAYFREYIETVRKNKPVDGKAKAPEKTKTKTAKASNKQRK
jgi:large subunit ribosomal protein L19e